MVSELNSNRVYPRRYFYPSLNTINYVAKQEMPISESICKTILCLPIYYDLTKSEIDYVSRIILRALNY